MKKKVLTVIFLFGFILRIGYLSNWLEDWDSVQFALALYNFSIVDHQPHPPGYPVYILMARTINFFVNNDTLSLTLLSAIAGAATIIPFYILLKDMVSKQFAVLAALLLLVTPIHWSLSEVALSNVPGMFFTTLTALLLYRARRHASYLPWAGFFVGLSPGVRFAEYSILFSLLFLVVLARKSRQDFIKSVFFVGVGITAWLTPLVLDTGWGSFIKVYTGQVDYISRHDSFLAGYTLFSRLGQIWHLFHLGYSFFFTPILIFAGWGIVSNLWKIKEWNFLFPIVWLSAYFLPLAFIYNLEVPRHLLPLLPPTIILSIQGLQNFKLPKLGLLIYSLCIILIFRVGLLNAQKLKALTPPTIQPVFYIKEKFDKENTVILTTFTYRQFQYYAPEFATFYGDSKEQFNFSAYKNIIIDWIGLKNRIEDSEKFKIVQEIEFVGPEEIFPRISKVKLYILQQQ